MNIDMDRRTFLAAALGSAGLLVLGGCSNDLSLIHI